MSNQDKQQHAQAVHQFRKAGAADWYDGHPDNDDGGGPYEVRTLYTGPQQHAQAEIWKYRIVNGEEVFIDPDEHEQAAQTNGLTTLLQAAGAMRLVRYHDGSGEPFEAYDKAIADRVVSEQRAKVHSLEAKIDALMLEHCPDEMSPEQIKNWGDHQRAVIDSRVTGNAQAADSNSPEFDGIKNAQAALSNEQVADVILHLIHHEHELNWFEGEEPFTSDEHERDSLIDLVRKARAIFATRQPAPVSDEADAYTIKIMGELLSAIAVTLKGPEAAMHRHSYHDLPKLVAELKLAADLEAVPVASAPAFPPYRCLFIADEPSVFNGIALDAGQRLYVLDGAPANQKPVASQPDSGRYAARYRWLRNADLDALQATYYPGAEVPEDEEFDNVIDAAMDAQQEPKS